MPKLGRVFQGKPGGWSHVWWPEPCVRERKKVVARLEEVDLLSCLAREADWWIELAKIPPRVVAVSWFSSGLVSVNHCVRHAIVHGLVPPVRPVLNGSSIGSEYDLQMYASRQHDLVLSLASLSLTD
ncbi:unnamed protein product [Prunus armeniaca]